MPDWLQRVLDGAVAGDQAPGVVAGVAWGDEAKVAWAGSATLSGAPMQRDTIFRISSMSKPITAVCALALVDAGQMELDEPVDCWLPELAARRVLRRPDGALDDTVPANRPITLRDLLTSTWGFGMQGAMFTSERPWPVVEAAEARALHTFGPPEPATTPEPDTWMSRLGELPLLAQPGERWLYQSSSQVLGVLASRVAGKPLDVVLSERVLRPLGMVDTGFWTAASARLATAYQRQEGVLVVSDPPDGQWARRPGFCDGAGGLVSTVDDLLRFGRMLRRGGESVLREETAAAMTRDQLTVEQRERVWPGFSFLEGRSWGHGLSVRPDGVYGWEGGFGSTWCNVPGRDLTVVVLTQRAADETGMPAVCEEVLEAARVL